MLLLNDLVLTLGNDPLYPEMIRVNEEGGRSGEGFLMLPRLRPIGVVASFLAASMGVGCSLFSRRSKTPPSSALPAQVHTVPPLHEALASTTAIHSRHLPDVLYPPPSPLPEQPSDSKLAGEDVVWAPGYWIWNTSEDNWLWVRGVWVHAPRGRRWVSGYWSIVNDGWRWVPGSWAIDPPPPPNPPPYLAYAPSSVWYNDPGLPFFAGYGMWWPMYPYGRFHHHHHGGATAPVVASPGPHPTEHLPFPLPPLASNVHNSPVAAPHLDMASIFASVPKPLASTFNPPQPFELHTAHPMFALHPDSHEHAQRISSVFSTAHLEAALHGHPGLQANFAPHALGSVGVHGGGMAHGSGGHVGGHGGGGHGGGGHGR